MSVWGIRALECDQGLDAMDCLTANYLCSKQQISLEEMAMLLSEHGLLCSKEQNNDHSQGSDISALVLAELLYEWHNYGYPQYDCECESTIWQSIKVFSASPLALEALLAHIKDIYHDVQLQNEERSLVKLWFHSAYWHAWVEHLESLMDNLIELLQEAHP